ADGVPGRLAQEGEDAVDGLFPVFPATLFGVPAGVGAHEHELGELVRKRRAIGEGLSGCVARPHRRHRRIFRQYHVARSLALRSGRAPQPPSTTLYLVSALPICTRYCVGRGVAAVSAWHSRTPAPAIGWHRYTHCGWPNRSGDSRGPNGTLGLSAGDGRSPCGAASGDTFAPGSPGSRWCCSWACWSRPSTRPISPWPCNTRISG